MLLIHYKKGTYKTRMWYCICDNKDGCNTASSLKNNSWLITFISVQIAVFNLFSRSRFRFI